MTTVKSKHQLGHCPCAKYHILLDPGCILFPWHKASLFPSDSKTPDDLLLCIPSETKHTSLFNSPFQWLEEIYSASQRRENDKKLFIYREPQFQKAAV